MTENKAWFESWFDSPYYHILYEDRDRNEAQLFIDNLLHFLKPPPEARMLDVACGRGRHAVYLNSKGYDVAAFDLSESNIAFDKQFENKTLSFYIHDMRDVFRTASFDYIFNLFSSFGYFDTEEENEKVIAAHSAALKTGGLLILDYLNTQYMENCMKEHEQKVAGNITFHISKKIKSGSVVKTIQFSDAGRHYEFHEKLRLFSLHDFEKIMTANNFVIRHVFGDYRLQPFDEKHSERLILLAEKK